MPHNHDHEELDRNHDHGHNHDYKNVERRHLVAAIAVNSVVMLLEFVGGILSGSLALLSDAGHMFTHIFALGTSYFAILLAARSFNDRKTYGYFRAEILATFVNSLFLFVVVIWIAYEAVMHIIHPEPIKIKEMIGIAIIGLISNLVSFFLLKSDSEKDINIKAAFLHVLTDTLSSVFIIIGGAVIYFTGWTLVDPLLSVGISVLILLWALKLLRESVNILLEAAPKGVRAGDVRKALKKEIPEIQDIHDIHVWVITSHLYAATLHVFLSDMPLSRSASVVSRIQALLKERFSITHVNVQIEAAEGECLHREGIGGGCGT